MDKNEENMKKKNKKKKNLAESDPEPVVCDPGGEIIETEIEETEE
jgi:hypothetical protein